MKTQRDREEAPPGMPDAGTEIRGGGGRDARVCVGPAERRAGQCAAGRRAGDGAGAHERAGRLLERGSRRRDLRARANARRGRAQAGRRGAHAALPFARAGVRRRRQAHSAGRDGSGAK